MQKWKLLEIIEVQFFERFVFVVAKSRKMKYYCYNILLILLIAFSGFLSCQNDQDKNQIMITLLNDFSQIYSTFNIPELRLSYKENLENIQSAEALEEQAVFFRKIQTQLRELPLTEIDSALIIDHNILSFIVQLNLERIQLSYDFLQEKNKRPIDWENGIYFIPLGKDWYRYFLKAWLGADVEPQDLTNFGMSEIAKVKDAIQAIQNDLGFENDTLAFYEYLNEEQFKETDSGAIRLLFVERQQIVSQNLWNHFYKWNLPTEKIEQGTSEALSQVPGYYRNNDQTFYFNLFEAPFNIRQIDFLYLHEAVPGHHFQVNLENNLNSIPPYRNAFIPNGYREGWAAYVEEIGEDMGLYRTAYDWMGKHEWDIIRSARVVIDVGINYRGWSDEKALSFWKMHIYNQDHLAMREINRMRNWPGQVHTYKYGANEILQLRKEAEAKLGTDFDIKAFHAQILNQGPVPWKVLNDEVRTDEVRSTN